MLFLKNTIKTPLKNQRVFSNFNNGCNLDIDTKKKIQIMFALTPCLCAFSFGTWLLTIVSMLKK